MTTMQEMVREFHAKMGAPNPDMPTVGTPGDALLRLRLINEEWGETCDALINLFDPSVPSEITAFADGLADLLYVIYGTAVSYGVEMAQPYFIPVKPGSRVWPNTISQWERILGVNRTLGKVSESLHVLQADPTELNNLGRNLTSLATMVLSLANLFNLPIELIFEEVHRSNMTKAPLDEHRKGGKGPGFTPPDIRAVLAANGWPRLAK